MENSVVAEVSIDALTYDSEAALLNEFARSCPTEIQWDVFARVLFYDYLVLL